MTDDIKKIRIFKEDKKYTPLEESYTIYLERPQLRAYMDLIRRTWPETKIKAA